MVAVTLSDAGIKSAELTLVFKDGEKVVITAGKQGLKFNGEVAAAA
jgi:hypothetical protein